MSAEDYSYDPRYEYDPIYFEELLSESERAVFLRLKGDDDQWIPKSLIAELEMPEGKSSRGRVWVATWWLKKEGLD